MLTRKHYRAIADLLNTHCLPQCEQVKNVLNGSDSHISETRELYYNSLIEDLCLLFKEDNPNFNIRKFKEAIRFDAMKYTDDKLPSGVFQEIQ